MKKRKLLNKLVIVVTCFIFVFSVADVSAGKLRSWDRKINKSKYRFKVLKQFNQEAVLDKETQLVWTRTPSEMLAGKQGGSLLCAKLELGGRLGWRLPTIEELASLVDSSQVDLTLPQNHPFIGVIPTDYLSSTVIPMVTGDRELRVNFGSGSVTELNLSDGGLLGKVWCVRGGSGAGGTYY